MLALIPFFFSACVFTAAAGNDVNVVDCQHESCLPLMSDTDEQLSFMQLHSTLLARPAKQDPAASSTLSPKPESGAEASGVTANSEGDLAAFLASLVANIAVVVVCIAFFMWARSRYPVMYCGNVIQKIQPYDVPDNKFFAWARAALGISVNQIAETVGLDQGMLIMFAQMNMRILACFGIPVLFITAPLNCFLGGFAAGNDYLSYLSMGNVEEGSWLYWVHAAMVWWVVFAVQVNVNREMAMFIDRRIMWMEAMPKTRASTIMVERIPEAYQSDERLKEFFISLYGESKVKKTWLAKRAKNLTAQYKRKQAAIKSLKAVQYEWEQAGSDPEERPTGAKGVDLIAYYKGEIVRASDQVKEELAIASRHACALGGVNACNGFVTFDSPKTAEIALCMQIGTDTDMWVSSTPPPPSSVRWEDLTEDVTKRDAYTALGYALTIGLYMLYLPSVIWITTIANKVKMPGPLQPLWESLAPTMGLLFMVSFLPTFLRIIFVSCFTLNDEARSQLILQDWYWFFQFVFVILVTAIGDSLFLFMKTIVVSPLEIMPILARTMPDATHFYMNFVVLAWASHASNFTRYIQLSKFVFFTKVYDEAEAIRLAEPEDQDYYGLGSRYARFTIMMSIGIIFGTLSPPIAILTLINFFFCRLFYGYLIPFAETKKPDIGGIFFVHACRHLFVANIFYVLLMTGVLYARAASGGPATVSIIALVYVVWSFERFVCEYQYDKLPFEEHLKDKTLKAHPDDGELYIQPEWVDESES